MLAKENRFKGRRDPRIVLKHGKSVRSGPLGAKYLISPNHDSFRVAVMVSTKISKISPTRNRIRRRIYEAVRLNPPKTKGLDIVISAFDKKVADMPTEELRADIDNLLGQVTNNR